VAILDLAGHRVQERRTITIDDLIAAERYLGPSICFSSEAFVSCWFKRRSVKSLPDLISTRCQSAYI
jgi:hypothetical protein